MKYSITIEIEIDHAILPNSIEQEMAKLLAGSRYLNGHELKHLEAAYGSLQTAFNVGLKEKTA